MREIERQAFQEAVDRRLSSLEEDPFLAHRIIRAEEGGEKIMKKKLSFALILAIVMMTLTMSAALALVGSRIAGALYGPEATVPPALLEEIQTPGATAASPLGQISLDELLYDGADLHLALTLTNPTGAPLLYTLDGLALDGNGLRGSSLYLEGAGAAGALLGGMVEETALPGSMTIYTRCDHIVMTDENGKFTGTGSIPEGKVTLTIPVAIWEPIAAPELVDYDQYEGHDADGDAARQPGLIVDETGCCNLELLRPSKYNLNVAAASSPSQVYAEAYKELGWAQLKDTMTLEIEVDLSKAALTRALPTQSEYALGDCRLVIDSFDMGYAGGRIEGRLEGKPSAIHSLMKNGLCLADREGNRILSSGCFWDDLAQGAQSLRISLTLAPVTGELPAQVCLAPVLQYESRWDETLPCYDPALEKPDNAIADVLVDFERAAQMELTIHTVE